MIYNVISFAAICTLSAHHLHSLKHPHPQYNKYLEWKNFKKATIENGNVVWGKNWDLIFPIEQLYNGEI